MNPSALPHGETAKHAALGDVVDTHLLREICKNFSTLYGLGIKVFDTHGQKVVDFRSQTTSYCGLMFQHQGSKQACAQLVGHIKSCDVESAPSVGMSVQCFSGLKYRITAILHEGDYIGRVIYGPFRPDSLAAAPAGLSQLAPTMDNKQKTELLAPIRGVAEQTMDAVVKHCQLVIEALVFAGFKAQLTSQMHIDSITTAYHELQTQNSELQAANERLLEMDRVKSNFVATVSHELRTPLTSVIGYSEMLLEGMAGNLSGEQREYVQTIMEKGESLLQLITSILDMSKIESGSLALQRQAVDLSGVLRAAASDVLPQAQKKHITVSTEVDPKLPRFVIDSEKLHRVVTNLLGNAVKFTPEGGKVEVKLAQFSGQLPAESGKEFDRFEEDNNRWLMLSVKDTGIGIPANKLRQVFEPFFQVDSSSTREYGGTGLGLAIVKNFVEAHGGAVWAMGNQPQGTEFTVVLPWAARAT